MKILKWVQIAVLFAASLFSIHEGQVIRRERAIIEENMNEIQRNAASIRLSRARLEAALAALESGAACQSVAELKR